MGHRALVAYDRGDGRYVLHYSHWGALAFALVTAITPETPYGGLDSSSTAVDPDPIATDRSLDEILADHVDLLSHEAFYVVDDAFRVTAYLPVRFAVRSVPNDPTPKDGDTVERIRGAKSPAWPGALVEVRPDDGPAGEYLRGWVEGGRRHLADLVADGTLSVEEAATRLERDIGRWEAAGRAVLPVSSAERGRSNLDGSRREGPS